MADPSLFTPEQIARLLAEREELLAANEQLRKENGHLHQNRDQLNQERDHLHDELKELRRLIFGSRKERFVPAPDNQLSLLPGEDPSLPSLPFRQTVQYERIVKQVTKKASRQLFPAHLPRVKVIIEPEEDVSGMRKIGEEITEELDLRPASLFVRRYIRPRYVSPQETFHTAELPARVIDRGIPGAGLLSQIICDKFVTHLPFYRQSQRYEQLGMKIPASTLDGWFEAACSLLEPLYEVLARQVLTSTYLQADETPVPVLDKQKKGGAHRGYHWVYYAPEKKLVLFDYQPGRGREGPAKLLKDYKGYLQTDGYAVYGQFEQREDIILVGCMAHARRKFEQALDSDKSRAEKVLLFIQQLYAAERQAREQKLSVEDRYALRQEKALPVMEELETYILTEYEKVLPKSSIGKAFHYLASRYHKIGEFLHSGRLEIDNNLVENSIRPVALGRKNYLFAGSHAGAERAAIVYSLLGSCKLQGINPYDYLLDVLQRLPEHPVNRLSELLPPLWKAVAYMTPAPQA
jgi:transposase